MVSYNLLVLCSQTLRTFLVIMIIINYLKGVESGYMRITYISRILQNAWDISSLYTAHAQI